MWSARMIAAFNGRDRQEKVDRSRHASEIGSDLNRGAGHESRKAGRCSWKTLLLSDAAFHGSSRDAARRTAPGHRAGARRSLVAVVLALRSPAATRASLIRKGPIGAAQRTILINALAIMLAIVVPTILATLGVLVVVPCLEHPGAVSAGLGLFRPHRARRLVHSLARHHIPRRHRLDRVA